MSIAKRSKEPVDTLLTFPSDLGWMGVVVSGDVVKRLTFGHCSSAAATKAALGVPLLRRSSAGSKPLAGHCLCQAVAHCCDERGLAQRNIPLVRRLQEYASGNPDSLRDISVDPGPMSDFQRRILEQCRRIPYGKTMSYAELAAKAGSPRAARAVGNCMAANRIPLLIPCHRVVCSDGRLGSYSAPGGVAMKRRILASEAGCAPQGGQSHFR